MHNFEFLKNLKTFKQYFILHMLHMANFKKLTLITSEI